MVIRIGGMLQPAWVRTATAFAGTTSAVADRLQPAITRTAALSATIFEQATNLVGALLTPASVVSFVLGIWRLGADLGLTGDFIIPAGLFSHWQVWMILALVLKTTGSLINRVAEPKNAEAAEGAAKSE
jgi:uncharacterized membrane protein YidH (DUF202 family)